MIITSTSNEKVKFARKLLQKKYRAEFGLFVVEGVNILKDLPDYVEVESVFVAETVSDEVQNLADKLGGEKFIVSQSVMTSLADTVTPSGLLAVVKTPSPTKCGYSSNALFLDGISDCGNLGTLIRTAASLGFLDIYLINCAEAYSTKTVRASMGGIFRVNLFDCSYDVALAHLTHYHSVAMDMNGEDISCFNPKTPTAIILGSEAHGVSSVIKQSADAVVAIKMQNGMESLNVAVAGGIAMFQLSKSTN